MNVRMIDIVLATYNGESFLEEQINSIQKNYGYSKFIHRIIITDDGSTDKTREIVARLMGQDDKIYWVDNRLGRHGPIANFEFGLLQSTTKYIMLCDQDDVWFESKLEESIKAMQRIENKVGMDKPILIFSDVQIVDEHLNEICSSYFILKNIAKDWHLKFKQLCQQNPISGCTMFFNRSLVEKSLPIPTNAYMHDWWVSLVAKRTGAIAFIDQPLVKYRQHTNNVIGANKRTGINLIFNFLSNFKQFESSFGAIIAQAKAFQEYENKNGLSSDQTVKSLVELETLNKYEKIKVIINKKIYRSNWSGNIALLLTLLKMKKK